MARVPGYPNVTTFADHLGAIRYRFRKTGLPVRMLPGRPGKPEFEAAYKEALKGKVAHKADVSIIPTASRPKTFRAAWDIVVKGIDWQLLDAKTKNQNMSLGEAFLSSRVAPDKEVRWENIPVADLKRRHVKMILSGMAETPHKAKHTLVAIRKMIRAAIDEEWIEYDPTAHIRWRPAYEGWRAWTRDEIDAFCSCWPRGTAPRTAFSLALWLGLRVSDVVRVRWDGVDMPAARVSLTTVKGGRRAVLKMAPLLIEDLMAVPRRGDYVLTTHSGDQRSAKAMTTAWRKWRTAAGLPDECKLHGLRKTLGKLAAEGGATTRMSMELLTHTDIQHAELYSRDAEQAQLAADALDCAVRAFQRKIA